jgi:hypothetical protein
MHSCWVYAALSPLSGSPSERKQLWTTIVPSWDLIVFTEFVAECRLRLNTVEHRLALLRRADLLALVV